MTIKLAYISFLKDSEFDSAPDPENPSYATENPVHDLYDENPEAILMGIQKGFWREPWIYFDEYPEGALMRSWMNCLKNPEQILMRNL